MFSRDMSDDTRNRIGGGRPKRQQDVVYRWVKI